MSLECHPPPPLVELTVQVRAGQGLHEGAGGRQQIQAEKEDYTKCRWSPTSKEKIAEQAKC